MDEEKREEQDYKVLKVLLVIIAITCFLGPLLIYASVASGYSPFWCLLVAIDVTCLIGAGVYWNKIQDRNMNGGYDFGYPEELVKNPQDTVKIDFYNECVEHEVYECIKEKDKQRATSIAKKHEILFDDISAAFEQAKELAKKRVEDEKKFKELTRLAKLRESEYDKYIRLNENSEVSGIDKRVRMLEAEWAEERRAARTLRDGANAVMSASQQKEKDWAIHGGLASGIAGTAAGVATAMSIQAENAEIRAQNEKNRKEVAPIIMTSYQAAQNHDRTAQAIEKEIEKTKLKLVSPDTPKECLSKLSFIGTELKISETGTITVTTYAEMDKSYKIFEDVTPVIDGTVIAKIYDGKKLIGKAKMVLPKYGISIKEKLTGMCLYCGVSEKTYTVEFDATNLWAMER